MYKTYSDVDKTIFSLSIPLDLTILQVRNFRGFYNFCKSYRFTLFQMPQANEKYYKTSQYSELGNSILLNSVRFIIQCITSIIEIELWMKCFFFSCSLVVPKSSAGGIHAEHTYNRRLRQEFGKDALTAIFAGAWDRTMDPRF